MGSWLHGPHSCMSPAWCMERNGFLFVQFLCEASLTVGRSLVASGSIVEAQIQRFCRIRHPFRTHAIAQFVTRTTAFIPHSTEASRGAKVQKNEQRDTSHYSTSTYVWQSLDDASRVESGILKRNLHQTYRFALHTRHP